MSITKGPWVLIRSDGRENSAIATIEPAPEAMETPNYWTVANVNTRRDEWAANALLIVAAPELLDSLAEMVNRFEALREVIGCTAESGLSNRARAAIAKATGAAS